MLYFYLYIFVGGYHLFPWDFCISKLLSYSTRCVKVVVQKLRVWKGWATPGYNAVILLLLSQCVACSFFVFLLFFVCKTPFSIVLSITCFWSFCLYGCGDCEQIPMLLHGNVLPVQVTMYRYLLTMLFVSLTLCGKLVNTRILQRNDGCCFSCTPVFCFMQTVVPERENKEWEWLLAFFSDLLDIAALGVVVCCETWWVMAFHGSVLSGDCVYGLCMPWFSYCYMSYICIYIQYDLMRDPNAIRR